MGAVFADSIHKIKINFTSQRWKELKKQAQKEGQPNAYVLQKFCKGYNLNVNFEEKNPNHVTNPPKDWVRRTFDEIQINWNGKRLLRK